MTSAWARSCGIAPWRPIRGFALGARRSRTRRRSSATSGCGTGARSAAAWPTPTRRRRGRSSRRRSGPRSRSPAREFFRGYPETALGPAEVVTALRLPAHGARMGHGLAELVRRSGDFAMVSACAVLGLDGAGRCTHAAVAMGGVGPSALRMRAAERLLVGQPPGDRALDEAADAVRDEVAPESDVHASAEYRRAMARVMARRALRAAAARAGGASPDAGPGAVRS